ncbi:hypothetical protein [Longirhabdus pacifica]|uniref:hypothetical protein n=1 Tax=Longirhabdus pacifica TaxID=2305227 RepID=UPI001008D59C|nr:hypothetical protein [Longirhabdus pacifica]
MFMYYSIGILLICYVVLCCCLFITKTKRAANSKLVSMILPMSLGLCLGFLLGIHFHHSLFIATISSVFFISICIVLLSLPLGYIVLVEGLLSGVMSAMMGAMLAIMLDPIESMFLLLLSLLLFLCITTIELFNLFSPRLSSIQFFISLLLCMFLVSFIFVTFPKQPNLPMTEIHHNH